MNERIKQLADEAIEDMPGAWNIPDEFCEKFAELIVWNCMLICEDVMKKDNSALGCWSEIKRTFRS